MQDATDYDATDMGIHAVEVDNGDGVKRSEVSRAPVTICCGSIISAETLRASDCLQICQAAKCGNPPFSVRKKISCQYAKDALGRIVVVDGLSRFETFPHLHAHSGGGEPASTGMPPTSPGGGKKRGQTSALYGRGLPPLLASQRASQDESILETERPMLQHCSRDIANLYSRAPPKDPATHGGRG